MIVKKTLEFGAKQLKESKTPAIDAEVLLVYCLKATEELMNLRTKEQITKSFLYTNPDFETSPKTERIYKKLILRCKKGEPIAYITHNKEFFGLDFYVDKNVLIPRPETEILVEEALAYCSSTARTKEFISSRLAAARSNNKCRILDLGTGSGNIIISIAVSSKQKAVNNKYYATDISNKALKIARKNARKHQVKIRFYKSDLFNKIPKNIKFDAIIANLPYLWERLPNFEPKLAFDGGKDGLKIISKFLKNAKTYLAPKGIIIIEIDPRQITSIKNIAKNIYPGKKVLIKQDLSKLDRMMILS